MRDLVPVSYIRIFARPLISFHPHIKPARIEPSTEPHVGSASRRVEDLLLALLLEENLQHLCCSGSGQIIAT
jgi:hypothetical protein